MPLRAGCVCLLFFAIAAPAHAQRYDLGQRLRMMERAWDSATPQNRAAAVAPLKRAVALFFSGKAPEAGAALDAARFRLLGIESPSDAFVWANSLVVRPAARLVDPADGSVQVELPYYYDTKKPFPNGAFVRVTVVDAEKPFQIDMLDVWEGRLKGSLPLNDLRPGEYTIRFQVMVGNESLASYSLLISCVPEIRNRLSKLKAAVAELPAQESTARQSLKGIVATLDLLSERYELETDFPAARLFDDAEGLVSSVKTGAPYLKPERSGEFWLTVPTPAGNSPIRLFVPAGLKSDKPVPLVVAMHGLGGSENLFFDGYGDGAAVRACRERGWMMVATRAGGILNSAPPVAQIVDELAKIYPIDLKRVFVMGHSMGAAHTMVTVQASPGRFAAAAALGGGGSIRTPAAVKDLPVLVACGADDFALASAKSLTRALERAGAAVTYKEFPDVEHLVIVQAAMPGVFAFFDRCKP